MNDLIDRQAAIDALAEQMPTLLTPDGSHPADEGIFMAQEIYVDCIETIKILPSAEPVIIHCKDCKYGNQDEDGWWFCSNLGCQMGEKDGSGFCSDAERRTDETN